MESDILFSSEVIECCCILHNICEKFRDNVEKNWLEKVLEAENVDRNPALVGRLNNNAQKLREDFVRGMYKNRLPLD